MQTPEIQIALHNKEAFELYASIDPEDLDRTVLWISQNQFLSEIMQDIYETVRITAIKIIQQRINSLQYSITNLNRNLTK